MNEIDVEENHMEDLGNYYAIDRDVTYDSQPGNLFIRNRFVEQKDCWTVGLLNSWAVK